jgi:N-acetyl sugar amidotransferase
MIAPRNSVGYCVCARCVLDTTVDPLIRFDGDGVCNHCRRNDDLRVARTSSGPQANTTLTRLVEQIKSSGQGREYDCIIGVSGGVDSTYVAYLVKQLGLRALAVHFDNGWNSELAVKNIEHVLNKLGIDLFTYVVDWPEFRDLQISFLKASTPDGEIPTDHAIFALLWREASRRGIRYIISGMNFATESISIPDWAYGHSDWRYIRDVHRRFGMQKLRTYPHFSLPYLFFVNVIRRVRTVSILNYIDYHKDEAMTLMQDHLGWRYYGGKHHESIYTRFYQGYVLPRKFGIDKRYAHLSDLINAGQITRESALQELAGPPYPVELQQQDLAYVTKKLGLSAAQFDWIMRAERKSFRDYRNSFQFVRTIKDLVNWLRRIGLYPK